MAASPDTVTHAFWVNDYAWAQLILRGVKRIENRSVCFAPGWYGVGVTLTAYTPVERELAFRKEFPWLADYTSNRDKGKVVGVVRVGYALPSHLCKADRWCVPSYRSCNIITHVVRFTEGVPARGNFGAYPLKDSEAAVQRAALACKNVYGVKATGAETDLPERPGVWDKPRTGGKGAQGKRAAEEATEAAQVPAVKKAKPQGGAAAQPAAAPLKPKGPGDIRAFLANK